MKRKINILPILLIFFLASCSNQNSKEFVKEIDLKNWESSTLLFLKDNCGIINSASIVDNNFVKPDRSSFPKKINEKLIYSVPEQIQFLTNNFRKKLINGILLAEKSFKIKDNKFYISDFYLYNQSNPYYIVYSNINDVWKAEYSNKSNTFILSRYKGNFKNTGQDHSFSAKEDNCIKKVDGMIRDIEILTEFILKDDKVIYNTKYIYLGS